MLSQCYPIGWMDGEMDREGNGLNGKQMMSKIIFHCGWIVMKVISRMYNSYRRKRGSITV